MLIDLAFLISIVRLFYSFIQNEQKDFFNDFVLKGKGLVSEVEADLKW